jgi:rubrerythrin
MSTAKLFYSLKEAENRTADLYSLISLNSSLKYPELSPLFESLEEDEKLHAKQIDMMHQIFAETEDSFVSDPDADRLIDDFLHFIEDFKKYFLQNFEKMNTGDILSLALGIENNLVEKHRQFFVQATDPGIKKLFENLTFGDRGHIQKLQDFELK